MTIQEFLATLGTVSYVFLIVISIFFGMTLAVQVYVSSAVKKTLKNTRANFNKISDKNAKIECLKIISQAEIELVDALENQRKSKRKKQADELNVKDVFLDLFKSTASVFSNYGGKERGYLSFTEREIFSVIQLLCKRVEDVVDSSGVFLFKCVNVSTFIIALNFYKSFENFKNKFWVSVIIAFIDFFLWFGRVFSPHSITKYVLKEFATDNLSILVTKAVVEIFGKELAYIYYEKSLVNQDNRKA